ncbi:hypothetical protein DOTSEDRAFT_75975 [Dothistroma septosporum NZE10]|uniref:Extracellular membrane protein CFEM domain-containing protein n=1 Tax=Dothistroma septosporum (strain NZE10 / CBS 128990) TaxID=675120 RepID=M2YHW9_DOTSN|nr:hypothetical protein DOTSEDRAFT_75975 [Dothistroma septosporum NZE10]
MKHGLVSSTLITLVAASPQWSGPNGGGQGGPLGGFPSCVSSCRDNTDYSDYRNLCDNNDNLNNLNTCVDGSSCSDQEKGEVKQAIVQLCANAGATITAAPFASYSATSGGSAWPTAWTTNSAWASAVSAWNENATGPVGEGWGGSGANGGYGPFGHRGPGGHGWGNGPWESSGAWTSGPWTSWWGTNGCPASTWSGWTDGPWSTAAPWTTWSGCVATTTGSSIYTTTVTPTTGGSAITSVATSFGIRVAEATQDLQSSTVNSDSGAMPTNMAFAGSAAGVVGVVAGAILL